MKKKNDPSQVKYLTFTAEQPNSTIRLSKNNYPNDVNLQYSTNNGKSWINYRIGQTITLTNVGDTVKFKGNNEYFNSTRNYYYFTMSGRIAASGDITSILNNEGGDWNLSNYVFSNLFNGCTSLTTAPNLPSTQLANYCYSQMFYGCTNLSYIKAMFTTTPSGTYTNNWVQGVSNNGTFVKNSEANWGVYGSHGIPVNWSIQDENGNELPKPLTFETRGNSATIKIAKSGSINPSLNYAKSDGSTGTLSTSNITIPSNSSICIYGVNSTLNSFSNYFYFVITGNVYASGDVTSIINGIGGNCNLSSCMFYGLFSGCTSLTTAPELPATTLADNCYQSMFIGCTSLTTAPNLPATTLASSCYNSMFQGCTSLTEAPNLPATTLANSCYQYMFQGCTSLTEAPELHATTLANYCCQSMFEGCYSLEIAPELNATTLKSTCYVSMFNGCSNLKYIKAMFLTNNNPVSTTYNWVNGVSSSGTFVKNSAATWDVTGANGIPNGWTVETASE